jgi:hypothetical protein
MSLLAPWALWFSLVGAAVAALYVLKIRRRREVVPSLEFWMQFVAQTRARSLFQRLKRLLSLLLWLVIVACLVLSLGNPVVTVGRVRPQSIAVVLDNSASMQAIEDAATGDTRLMLARRALGDLLDLRPVDDEWLLLEAGRQPRVLASWTRDRTLVRDASHAITPHGGSADLAAAKDLAGQLLEGKANPLLVIISDGGDGEAARLAGTDESVVLWSIGSADDNLGVADLRARAHRRQAEHVVYVRVVSAAKEELATQLVFELDGSTVAVEPVTLPPGGSWERTIPITAPQGGVLRAWIDRPDALAADNEAFAILEPLRAATVLLVTPPSEAFFFERALLAMDPLVDAADSHTISPEEYRPPAEPPDLTIFNNCLPASLPESGAMIFVNRVPPSVGASQRGSLERPSLSVARRDHPLMQYMTIGPATVARAMDIMLSERAVVLADTADGSPLIFLVQHPDRQILCLAFDVLESDLPFRNAFPVLLRNAVTWLVTEQQAWLRDHHAVGEAVEPLRRLPDGVESVTVVRPGAAGATTEVVDEVTVPVRGGMFRFDATADRGPRRFTIGDDFAYTAVNLTDARESRIAPAITAYDPAERLGLTGRLFGAVPWLALAAAAAGLIGLEWLTYHYRWTE